MGNTYGFPTILVQREVPFEDGMAHFVDQRKQSSVISRTLFLDRDFGESEISVARGWRSKNAREGDWKAPVFGYWSLLECRLAYVIKGQAGALHKGRVRSKFSVGHEVKKEILVEEVAL